MFFRLIVEGIQVSRHSLLETVLRGFNAFFVVFLPREFLRSRSAGGILAASSAKSFLTRNLEIVFFAMLLSLYVAGMLFSGGIHELKRCLSLIMTFLLQIRHVSVVWSFYFCR
jgi:hypothetical protein